MNWKYVSVFVIVCWVVSSIYFIGLSNRQNVLLEKQNKDLENAIYLLDMKIGLEEDLLKELKWKTDLIDRMDKTIDQLVFALENK